MDSKCNYLSFGPTLEKNETICLCDRLTFAPVELELVACLTLLHDKDNICRLSLIISYYLCIRGNRSSQTPLFFRFEYKHNFCG